MWHRYISSTIVLTWQTLYTNQQDYSRFHINDGFKLNIKTRNLVKIILDSLDNLNIHFAR